MAEETFFHFKPGLHISRKYRKHVLVNMFLGPPDMAWFLYRCNDHISQEILAIDVLTALKSSSKHRRKHFLRLLRPMIWRPGFTCEEKQKTGELTYNDRYSR